MNIEFAEIKTEAQAQTAAEIADITWREHYAPLLSDGQIEYMLKNQSKTAILEHIGGSYAYYIIKSGGADAGYTALDRGERLENLLFISKIYLLKQYRAGGIGRALIEFYTHLGKKEGYDGLFLHVNKYNPSVEAYKRLGFSVKFPMITQIGGGYVMDDYCMELAFGAKKTETANENRRDKEI